MIEKFLIKPLKFDCNSFNSHKHTNVEKHEKTRKYSYSDVGFKRTLLPIEYYYIKTFTLFKKKEIILSNLNIFVGDNGSGKTTLIKEITKNQEKVINLGNLSKDSIRNKFIDSANKNYFNGGSQYNANLANFLFSGSASNGEVILDNLKGLDEVELKDCIFIFDECETSLSLVNMIKLRNIIKKLSEHNQIFLSTHNPIFMELSDKVFDVEEIKWKNRKNYLNNILKTK